MQRAKGTLPGVYDPAPYRLSQLLAFDTGDVFLVGTECDSADRLAVERWKPNQRQGEFTPLSFPGWGRAALPHLMGPSPNNIALSAYDEERNKPRLAHFDGSRWTEVETPRHAVDR